MATPSNLYIQAHTALWVPGTRSCSGSNQVLTRPSFCLQIAAQKVLGLCSSVPMVCDVGLLLKKGSSLDQNLILSCWADTFQQCHSLWEKKTPISSELAPPVLSAPHVDRKRGVDARWSVWLAGKSGCSCQPFVRLLPHACNLRAHSRGFRSKSRDSCSQFSETQEAINER